MREIPRNLGTHLLAVTEELRTMTTLLATALEAMSASHSAADASRSEDVEAERPGLLGYDGLARELAVDGHCMTDRNIKSLAARHRKILKPIKLGHRTVGFRRVDVERFKAYLAGEEKMGGRL